MPVLSEQLVCAVVRTVQPKDGESIIALRTDGRWSGPTQITDSRTNKELDIYPCDSQLQMRSAIQNHRADRPSVLLTQLDETAIDSDILARLANRRVCTIDRWKIVGDMLGITDRPDGGPQSRSDHRLSTLPWMADQLIDLAEDAPRPTGGYLGLDYCWGLFLDRRLGLPGNAIDLTSLLVWSSKPASAAIWRELDAQIRADTIAWIEQSAGPAAANTMRSLAVADAPMPIPIGLVLRVLSDPSVLDERDVIGANTRLEVELQLPSNTLSAGPAHRWAEAAEQALMLLDRTDQHQVRREADQLLERLGARPRAHLSDFLPLGLRERLDQFAKALESGIAMRAKKPSEAIIDAYDDVNQHRLTDHETRNRMKMSLRLLNWLNRVGDLDGGSVAAMCEAYATDGGFVDWARSTLLRSSEKHAALARTYSLLLERVTERRQLQNRQFAEALSEHGFPGADSPHLVLVESFLDRVVAPLAKNHPVLVVVLDGMSHAVFRELLEDIEKTAWDERALDSESGNTPIRRLTGIAAVPSITEVCRTSLLCGDLGSGTQDLEKRSFATHRALREAQPNSRPPVLFHKADLDDGQDTGLAQMVRECISNPKQRVVGAVINAIDDNLGKGDQTHATWNLASLRTLDPLLAEAEEAGRVVVLVSDHGHVLDNESTLTAGEGGARWRSPSQDTPCGEGEVQLTWPRVVTPKASTRSSDPASPVVVPWSESVRYGSKANGYHGGLSLQEMLVPISILQTGMTASSHDALAPMPLDTPDWWLDPLGRATVSETKSTVAPTPATSPKKTTQAAPLFDAPKPAQPKPTAPLTQRPPSEPWVEALLRSEILELQKPLAGRQLPDDKRLVALLQVLTAAGNTMTFEALAKGLQTSRTRLLGEISIFQRILNVEGYMVLSRNDNEGKVHFNRSLLIEQFELDGS